jgi:hypothetical protein
MPFDATEQAAGSKTPSELEINSQLDILSAQDSIKGDKRVDLLRFLVDQKRKERFIGPFQVSKKTPTGKQILYEFYLYWSRRNGSKPPLDEDDTEVAGKKLIGGLAAKLEEYYQNVPDPVVIEIPRGRNTGYEPLIAYRGDPRLSATRKAVANGLVSDNRAHSAESRVDCHCLGNDREAIEFVIDLYRQSPSKSPRLLAVRDTHTRPSLPLRHREDHKELEDAFGTFLTGIDSEITFATLILGHEVDREYLRMIQRATMGHGDKLKCFRIRTPGPLMNFILLDYDDFTSEVLFGWGQGKPGWPGAVFKSNDKRLVEEFSNFYEALLQASDPIAIGSLLKP